MACRALIVCALTAPLALGAAPAVAATFTVTNAADSGAGSLRAAIAGSSSGDTINFAPALDGGTITLMSGELQIGHDLTIAGPGANNLTVSADNASRVIYISAGMVDISGLTVTAGDGAHASDGSTNQGGDIDVEGTSTSVTLDGMTITDGDSALFGGGIGFSGATAQITNSTISGNAATGFAVGGGIWQDGGTMTLTNDTIAANTATANGGGIAEATAPSSPESAALLNVTLSGNQATSASGKGGNIFATSGTTFKNTIIAGGIAAITSNCGFNNGSAPVSHGDNLEDANTCNFTNGVLGDETNTNPMLGPLREQRRPDGHRGTAARQPRDRHRLLTWLSRPPISGARLAPTTARATATSAPTRPAPYGRPRR